MGSLPEPTDLLCLFQQRPEALCWGISREILITRGPNNKLGFRFHTIQSPALAPETLTVVISVKDDCQVTGGCLNVWDRIIAVNAHEITQLSKKEVCDLLSQSQSTLVVLRICALIRTEAHVQVKRFLSVNSGTSAGSGTPSVNSSGRPTVKRFAKSNSTESDNSQVMLGDLGATTGVSEATTGDLAATVRDSSATSGISTHTTPTDLASIHANKIENQRIFGSHRICALKKIEGMAGNQTVSMPDTTDSEIILQDIVLSEVPGSLRHPLPSVSTPPTSTIPVHLSTNNNTSSAGTRRQYSTEVQEGCETFTSVTDNLRSLGVEICRSTSCDLRTCLWHKFVISYPQYVIWDPSTKTVVLEKNGNATFGFKYKVKKHDGPPVEVFALVVEVLPGGVAWSHLLPGDWIRSINGIAVISAKEAFCPNFRDMSSLRLVIQRPDKLSRHATNRLRQLAQNMHISLKTPSSPSSNLITPQTPLAVLNVSDHTSFGSKSHSSCAPNFECHAVGGSTVGDCNSQASLSPDTVVDYYPYVSQSPMEHIPLVPLVPRDSSQAQRCIMPCTRVVVCGSRAVDFVQGMLDDANVVVDSSVCVHCFPFSLHRDEEGRVRFHTWPEPIVALAQDQVLKTGMSGSAEKVPVGPNCLNVELYVIADENYLHHCVSWLFTPNTVVLLTFDVPKLLNQAETEISRLAAMVHTVQSGASMVGSSSSAAVCLYGILSASESSIAVEEVQAIFYVTQHGPQLLENHALSIPDVATPSSQTSMSAIRAAIYQMCLARVQNQTVSWPAVELLEVLLSSPQLQFSTLGILELIAPGCEEMGHSYIQDLVMTGNLIPQRSHRQQVGTLEMDYFLSCNLFRALSTFFLGQEMDSCTTVVRQKWFKLISSGRVSRADLCDILASDILNRGKLTLDILEDLGIVFKVRPSSTLGLKDSGFSEEALDYLVPFGLMGLHSQGQHEAEGSQFVMTFQGHLAWQTYFQMLSALSMLPATESFEIDGACTCCYKGMKLLLRFMQNKNAILVTANRCDLKSREGISLQPLERLFRYIIPADIPFVLQRAETIDSNIGNSRAGVSHTPAVGYKDEETKCKERTVNNTMTVSIAGLQPTSPRGSPLTSLPWSVLKKIAIRLSGDTVTACTWRDVAEHAGWPTENILAYEALQTRELPALIFLKEWMNGTVEQLLEILTEINRPDVQDIILDHLSKQKS